MNSILEEVRAYFNAIENPTEQEKRIQIMLSDEFYPITSVCRDDLKAKGFDTDKATDDLMRELAHRMADDYCEQLFWSSMEIIAEIMGIPKKKILMCPKCDSELIDTDVSSGICYCSNCGMEWDDSIYVLVEFPEDSLHFENEDIGYPAFDREDNCARFVPEYNYMHHCGKTPERSKCYRIVEWPASQEYIGNDECILINDDEGLDRFRSSAYWVPVKLLTRTL